MLHPAMAFFAFHTHFAASAFNRLDFIREVPKLASGGIVVVLFGISSVILDVVGVGALVALMAILN